MPSLRVNFRAVPPLGDRLAERTEPPATEAGYAAIARRDLERYYAALAAALADWTMTEAEAMLICDACHGVTWEPHTVDLLWAQVDQAIRADELDRKHDVIGAHLVAWLRDELSPFDRLAVADAAERFWLLANADDDGPSVGLLRAVGLVRG